MARFLLSTVLLALFLGHSATALKCAKGVAKPSDSFLKLADVGIPITRMRDRLKPCTSEDPTVTPQCYRVTIGDDLTFAGCTTETLPFLNEVGIDICQSATTSPLPAARRSLCRSSMKSESTSARHSTLGTTKPITAR
uniref:UPAR/Ly6 domain-containing protein n=1 Tax=Steinernema glaseri TaxID=37863 RepID=A0A1I8ANX2_9BILA